MARELGDVGAVRSRVRAGGAVQWRLEFRRGGDGKKLRVYAWPPGPGGRPRPFRDERDAADALALIRGEVAKRKPLTAVLEPWLARARPENLLLARAERWLAHVEARVASGERSPTYLRELRRYVTHGGYWAVWWEGCGVHDLTYADLEDWSTWLARAGGADGKGIGGKTRRQVLGAFRTFLRWLKRRNEVDAVPEFPTVDVDEYSPTIIDLATQGRVLAAVPWERRGAFLACCLSVRPGEARALDVGDFRVDGDGRPWLTIARAMKGPNSTARVGGPKERKIASIPLDEAAAEWIRWRIEARAAAMARGGPSWLLSTALFPNPTGRRAAHRWLSNALREEWNRARKRAGVEVEVKMYEGTKHAFATDAVARGVPLEWVQKFLRHADRRSTERYARLANAGLVAVLPQRAPDEAPVRLGARWAPGLRRPENPSETRELTGGADGTRTRNPRPRGLRLGGSGASLSAAPRACPPLPSVQRRCGERSPLAAPSRLAPSSSSSSELRP